MMKYFIPSLITLLLYSLYGITQNIVILDDNFLAYLIDNGVDKNVDGVISFQEAELVNKIKLERSELSTVYDLTGIEAFVNLDTLIVSGQEIDSIPLFSLTKLLHLDCSSNNLVPPLNVSNNLLLRELVVHEYEIKTIDLSKNSKIEKLEFNYFNEISLENLTELRELSCGHIPKLNISNNLKLTKLACINQTSLDVSRNLELLYLEAYATVSDTNYCLTSIDLSKNKKLQYVSLGRNLLLELDVSNNPNLVHLNCSFTKLTKLDIANNTLLTKLDCSSSQIRNIDFTSNKSIKELVCCFNPLDSLDISSLANLETLDCRGSNLKELNLFNNINLKKLDCSSNSIKKLDLNTNNNLRYLYCENNLLTFLDVSTNSDLIQLRCNENMLSELIVKGAFKLESLELWSNKLRNINIRDNTKIGLLQIGSNDFDTLDFSNNDDLYFVSMHNLPNIKLVCVSDLPVPFSYNASECSNFTFEKCETNLVINNSLRYIFYPNPVLNNLNIEIDDNWNERFEVSIFDNWAVKKYGNWFSSNQVTIDLSQFSSGCYFLRISDKDGFLKHSEILFKQ